MTRSQSRLSPVLHWAFGSEHEMITNFIRWVSTITLAAVCHMKLFMISLEGYSVVICTNKQNPLVMDAKEFKKFGKPKVSFSG